MTTSNALRSELVKAPHADPIGPFLPEGNQGAGADDKDAQGMNRLIGRLCRPAGSETQISPFHPNSCAPPAHNLIFFKL